MSMLQNLFLYDWRVAEIKQYLFLLSFVDKFIISETTSVNDIEWSLPLKNRILQRVQSSKHKYYYYYSTLACQNHLKTICFQFAQCITGLKWAVEITMYLLNNDNFWFSHVELNYFHFQNFLAAGTVVVLTIFTVVI